jgi:hypothetical protein
MGRMIGALLSNTPANLLRSSGVAGEVTSGSGDMLPGREPSAVRDSLASPRAEALRGHNVPTLTSEAILALQETNASDLSSRRRSDVNTGNKSVTERDEAGSGQLQSYSGQAANSTDPVNEDAAGQETDNPASAAGDEDKEDPDGDGLNEAEEKQVQEMKQRDREVRAHEQAHARVGGAYASAPSYTFQQGPDGKRYAVGGEVQIDTAKERTPEATVRKMRVVISAALAPAEPSGQDLSVAQQARSQLSEAQAELRQQKLEELKGDGDTAAGPENAEDIAGAAQSSPGDKPGLPDDMDSEANGQTARDDGGSEDDSEQSDAQIAAIEAYQAAIAHAVEQQATTDTFIA